MSNDTSLDSSIQIPLTRGYTARVSLEDADLLSQNWYAFVDRKTVYALSHSKTGKPKHRRMHRVIMERILGRSLTKGEMPDHIDRNGLNNTRSNLRLATNTQNMQNRPMRSHNTSGYKGVTWVKKISKWQATIKYDGKRKVLGQFSDIKDAARAYNRAAILYHGEFAYLNAVED